MNKRSLPWLWVALLFVVAGVTAFWIGAQEGRPGLTWEAVEYGDIDSGTGQCPGTTRPGRPTSNNQHVEAGHEPGAGLLSMCR